MTFSIESLAHIKIEKRIFFRAMATIFQIERTIDDGSVPSNLVLSKKGLLLEENVQTHFPDFGSCLLATSLLSCFLKLIS